MRKYHALPSAEYLRECLRYNKRAGTLFWKHRPREHFKTLHAFRDWNTKYAGKRTFTAEQSWGHMRADIQGRTFAAARIIWKMVTGEDPPTFVDHKDRNGSNNRWHNLRLATHSQNTINSSLRSDNKSGCAGVCQRENGTWRAYICVDHKAKRLGTFDSKADAIFARREAVKIHYGEFAP